MQIKERGNLFNQIVNYLHDINLHKTKEAFKSVLKPYNGFVLYILRVFNLIAVESTVQTQTKEK